MTLDTSAWPLRVDARLPDVDPSVVAAKVRARTVVAAIAGVVFVVAVIAAVAAGRESLAIAPLIVLAGVAAVMALIAVVYRWRIAKLASFVAEERIAAVVLDGGIVIHGGLVIAWPEVLNVDVTRTRRVAGRGLADGIARSLHAAEGVSDLTTIVMFGLREWDPIDRRATTKAMRRPLMKPVLGMEASATITLSDLPEAQVQQVLAAIQQQAQRYGIPVQHR